MCALSGLGGEELTGTVIDWAIVDSLRATVVVRVRIPADPNLRGM
jgi:hypothetical protein